MSASSITGQLSAAAKELFLACRRELRTKAADECAKWNLQSLVDVLDGDYEYFWQWDEIEHVFRHSPAVVLACGGNRKNLEALRASLKTIMELRKRWADLDKREDLAKRTIDEESQMRLADGTCALPMAATPTEVF